MIYTYTAGKFTTCGFMGKTDHTLPPVVSWGKLIILDICDFL